MKFRITTCENGYIVESQRSFLGVKYWKHCIPAAGLPQVPWIFKTFEAAMKDLLESIEQNTKVNSGHKLNLGFMEESNLFYRTVEDITRNSRTTPEDAELYMRLSNEYERDSVIVKKMANAGLRKEEITRVIKVINIDD